jgi:hypothetical protein
MYWVHLAQGPIKLLISGFHMRKEFFYLLYDCQEGRIVQYSERVWCTHETG